MQGTQPYLIMEINSMALSSGGNSSASLLAMILELGYRAFHIDPSLVGLTKADVVNRRLMGGASRSAIAGLQQTTSFRYHSIPPVNGECKMPHITVTIPVYNRAPLVGRTIDSVLVQVFQDWDLLVVEDGSTDDTVAVVREYCRHDPRVHLEVNPQNLGLTRNWNRCLDLARGPLVQVLLSDDLMDADYLGLVSEFFETHPQVGFVASSCRYIDPEDRVFLPGEARPPQLYRAGDEAVTALLTGGFPHVSSIVIRRECYEKLGKFNEKIWHGPDVEMDARLASQYDFYHFGAIHTSFRRHGSNMGNLEYLRSDFLEVDTLKKRLAWGYLSEEGRHHLGVLNLEAHLTQDAAQVAMGGAVVAIGYGRPELSRYYLGQALRHDSKAWRHSSYWKVRLLLLWPAMGRRFLQRRWNVSRVDRSTARSVEQSLNRLRQDEGNP